MKKIYFLLLLYSSYSISQIPNWEWAKSFNVVNTLYSRYMSSDNNGNVYLYGDFKTPTISIDSYTLTNNSLANRNDVYIAKFDTNGNVQWARNFGSTGWDHPSTMQTDAFGNTYISGSFESTITFDSITLFQSNGSNFLVKLDTNGNVVFARNIQDSNEMLTVTSIQIAASGNIYLTGIFNSQYITLDSIQLEFENYTSFSSTPYFYRTFMSKLDNNGNFIWAKAIQSTSDNYMGITSRSLGIDGDENVIVGGYMGAHNATIGSITFNKTNSYTYSSNLFVLKLNSSGVEQWGFNTGSIYENNNSAETIAVASDGSIYASGYITNTVNFGAITVSSSGGSNLYTAKFNPNGSIAWVKNASGTAGFGVIRSSDTDASGNLYVTGHFMNSSLNFGNGIILTNNQEGQLFVVKYNSAGTPLWGRKAGDLNANAVAHIKVFNPNEIYVAGIFDNPSMTFGTDTVNEVIPNTWNLFLAKLFYQDPLSNENFQSKDFKIYPNPADDFITIASDKNINSVIIINSLGQVINNVSINNFSKQIDIKNLKSGYYILKIKSESEIFTLPFLKK